MMTDPDDQIALASLEQRLKAILPEQYQDDGEVLPLSMGSAGLKYDSEGRVAWNEIWGSFCDLAMAGGPPHKGRLLEPGTPGEIAAHPLRYRAVAEEVERGIVMVTGLRREPHSAPGWIRIHCLRSATAGWLARAITMENVAVRVQGALLDLPIGPDYRIEKEIKNIITVIAKTFHYWAGHTSPRQQRVVSNLFAAMEVELPLLQPEYAKGSISSECYQTIARAIRKQTGLTALESQYAGWLGLSYADVPSAIWMMRALTASNVLARREETTLFVPVNPDSDPAGEQVVRVVRRVHQLLLIRADQQSGPRCL